MKKREMKSSSETWRNFIHCYREEKSSAAILPVTLDELLEESASSFFFALFPLYNQ